jgi:hypothetical protein
MDQWAKQFVRIENRKPGELVTIRLLLRPDLSSLGYYALSVSGSPFS